MARQHIDVPVVVTAHHAGRPAENSALGAGGLIGTLSAGDGRLWIGVLAWALGSIPHVITFVLDSGGIRPAWRRVIGP